MRLPLGLLLLLTLTLLHHACCKTTQGPDPDTSTLPVAEAANNEGAYGHAGDVVIQNGEETEPELDKKAPFDYEMENTLQGIEDELIKDGMKLIGDTVEKLAAQYVNGTLQGEPTYRHSELDVEQKETTYRHLGKRQFNDRFTKWEKGIVPYFITDEVSEIGVDEIKKAIKYIEDNTCLKFPPKTDTVFSDYNLSHTTYLNFVQRNGCWGYVGRVRPKDQNIAACNEFIVALHEITHALGARHEHQRNDAQLYVTTHPENAAGSIWSFIMDPDPTDINHSPYDYGSQLHYWLDYASSNGLPTRTINDKSATFLFNKKEGSLSHYDRMGINKRYDCPDKCIAENKGLECQNDGFQEGRCKCNCPEQFTGELCEKLIPQSCGGIFYLNTSNPSINISSPNYPEDSMDQECIWHIKGPKGQAMVLDVHNLNLKPNGSKCVDSLEIRKNLIAQPGERFCGTGPKASVVTYNGFMTLQLRARQMKEKKGFTSTLRLASDSEQCYNLEDRGSSYRGNVDYSQLYHKCVPWDQVKHCLLNKYEAKYSSSGLTNAYCRNPDNLVRPWCYHTVTCDYDFCDVCGLGRCHDASDDCAALIAKDRHYCKSDDGFRACHKTCKFCGRGHEKSVSSCPKPDLKDKNAVIDPSYENQATFEFGEKVKIDCKEKIDDKSITRDLTCTTDGKFAGDILACCAKTVCQDGYTAYSEACYKLFNNIVDFKRAQTLCEEDNALLVSIEDDAENTFVLMLTGRLRVWIGYEYQDAVGKWTWHDGVARNYTHWGPSHEFEQSGTGFAIMDIDGTWDDSSHKYRFVCKKHNKAYKGTETCACVDEDPKCTDFIRGNYRFCKQYAVYSSNHCRSSCGYCGAVTDCKNPGPVNLTVQKNKNASVTTGNYYEYECYLGYGLVSGNFGRTCLKDGTITGGAPICEPYVGNPVIPSPINDEPDSAKYMYMQDKPSMIFTRRGHIWAWKLYANSAANVTMMVIRPVIGSEYLNYTVVGMNVIETPNDELAVIPVAPADRISVEVGDRIAWYYMPGSNPSISLTVCSDIYEINKYAGPGPYTVGQKIVPEYAERRPCSRYSIGALMLYDEPYVGNAAILRPETDSSGGAGYMFMEHSAAMVFPRPGTVAAWKFYSKSPANITMMVVRPVTGTDYDFTVIGSNDVVNPPSGTMAVIPVPPADRISVEAGDMIAWYYWWHSTPTIAIHLDCDLYNTKTLWHGKGISAVGDQITWTPSNWKPCRQYSIGAVMDKTTLPQCKNPGTVANTMDITSPTGGFFQYECSNGYNLTSGNIYRECLEDGTLTGTPPVCEPSVAGHDAVHTPNVDGTSSINYMYIEHSPSMTFQKSGSIKAWRFYSNSPANITLMVVRPVKDSDIRFTLVGMNKITTPNAKSALHKVADSDSIRVNAGDMIAWYYVPGSNPSIPYSGCNQSDIVIVDRIIEAGPGPFTVGQEVVEIMTSWRRCRKYSIMADVDYSPLADCKDPGMVDNTVLKDRATVENTIEYECSSGYDSTSGMLQQPCLKDGTVIGTDPVCEPFFGNKAITRNNVDKPTSVGYMYIEQSPSMTFTKSGSIKAWKLYSKWAANITLMVLRPVEGSDTRFIIVGMTTITAPNGTAELQRVPESENIRVRAGDIIAWYYVPGSNPSIPFSYCSSSDVKVMWAGLSTYTIGKEISGKVQSCREYSIMAFLDNSPLVDCKDPGMVANTVQKNNGDYIEYECSSEYVLKSGSLYRPCLRDGTLSGTAPVCEPGVGHQAVERKDYDTPANINYTYIERSSSMTFTKSGSIKAWRLYLNTAANITLMVVRPVEGSETSFTVVGITDINAPNGTTDFESVPASHSIRVNAGDIIAWYYVPGSNPSLPYIECSSSEVKVMWAGPGPYTVGNKISGTVISKPCRKYSVMALLDYSPLADCKDPGMVDNTVLKDRATVENTIEYECSSGYGLTSGMLQRPCLKDGTAIGRAPTCEPYVGHEAVRDGNVDTTANRDYMYIERSSSMTFTKSGSIKAWKLYSKWAANITMIVVRPVTGSDSKFTIVAMNAIEAPSAEVAVIPVTPADRISVEAGDIIAWYYVPGFWPSIPYGECSSSDVSIIYAGPGLVAVGDEASGTPSNWKSCREYSIGAVMADGTKRAAGSGSPSTMRDVHAQQNERLETKKEKRSVRLARLMERANTIPAA